ncbi:unnamed protein product [Phaeothamnion confervicola]
MDSPDTLAKFRAEIDQIDDAAQDLILRRMEIVQKIAQAKAAANPDEPVFAMRPGREAAILRRLMARHSGNLPAAAIGRMWRELISAASGMQGPFEVAIFGSDDTVGFWDVARTHFGSTIPAALYKTPALVLQRVAEGKGVVGVLPVPGSGDTGSNWWTALAHAQGAGGNAKNNKSLRVVARLPFLRGPGQTGREALAVAPIDREETGNDRTYLLAFCKNEMSRAAVRRLLESCGIECEPVDTGGEDKRLMLFEAPYYIADEDPRLKQAVASTEKLLERILVAGGYAVPLQLPS